MEHVSTEGRALFPVLTRNGPSSPDPMALSLQVGLMVTSAVSAAVHLRVAEHIGSESKTIDELASQTQTHAPSLYLLMRALVGIGIFEEIDEQTHTFGHTERSRLLLSSAQGPLVSLWGADYQWNCWRDLAYTIKTGEPAMGKYYGEGANIWTYLNAHPDESQGFQQGLTINAGLIIPAILASYDFSDINTLVDMGGGHGALAVSLLQRYPHLTATLFDRASIIEQVKQESARDLSEAIQSRYTLLAGDFFTHIPSGADVYIFKNVLMDWSDDAYLQIMQHVRQALVERAGRLLVIEPVLSEASPFTKFFSLQMMMMMHAAKHRTLGEHQAILKAAGMTVVTVIPLGLEQMLLEVCLSEGEGES